MTGELRNRETAKVQKRIADANAALDNLTGALSRWTDTVRTDAEARQGVAAGAPLADDPELWHALDAVTACERARAALADVAERLDYIEQERTPRA